MDSQIIIDNINFALKRSSFTVEKLAENLDISRSTLTGYLKGTREFPLNKLLETCHALDIKTNLIFEEDFPNIIRRQEKRGDNTFSEMNSIEKNRVILEELNTIKHIFKKLEEETFNRIDKLESIITES